MLFVQPMPASKVSTPHTPLLRSKSQQRNLLGQALVNLCIAVGCRPEGYCVALAAAASSNLRGLAWQVPQWGLIQAWGPWPGWLRIEASRSGLRLLHGTQMALLLLNTTMVPHCMKQ